jgi:SAM-dependent methyltransferase
MGMSRVPVDWYRSSPSEDTRPLYWEEGAPEKVALAVEVLGLTGRERILDLACMTGQRTLELARRGYCVVGTDVDEFLLEVGGCEAELEDLYPFFTEADPRELEFLREFEVVLSLGGGAIGHFEDDADDLRVLQCVSRALRPGGRLLMQTPNLAYVERRLPDTALFESKETISTVEQTWNERSRRIAGWCTSTVEGEARADGPAPFSRRVYSIEELAELFESVGLELCDVYDEEGKRCAPTETQQELYVVARF